MATITFEGYYGAGPAWTDISTNTLVMCSSLTDLATAITVGQWQDGTHIGNDDPGTDQCGANHMNNVKYVSSGNMDLNGGGSEVITNITDNECTLRLHFNHTSSVTSSGARMYVYQTSVSTTTYAPDMEAYAFESGDSTWTLINDASATQGGDNTGERLDLSVQGAATDLYWYVALSVRAEANVGDHNDWDVGFALTYS